MTAGNYWERPTQRDPSGRLATRGVAKFQWAQIAQHGRVHHVDGVIVRWNFLGGTFQRPDMTFVLACGPQRHEVLPVVDPCRREICVRCDHVLRRREVLRG